VPVAFLGLHPNTVQWTVQTGFAFLLLHSLRWDDSAHAGAGQVRIFTSLAWAAHAFWWMHTGGAAWMACAVAGPVLAIYFVVRFLRGGWAPRAVPIAAIFVMLSWPGDFSAHKLQTTPVGLLAVVGSFLLFGLGTLAALTKQRWNKTEIG